MMTWRLCSMPSLTDLLHEAIGEPTVSSPFEELEGRAVMRRSRRRRRRAYVAGVTVVALVFATGVVVRTRSTSHQRVATEPNPSTVTTSPSTVTTLPSG